MTKIPSKELDVKLWQRLLMGVILFERYEFLISQIALLRAYYQFSDKENEAMDGLVEQAEGAIMTRDSRDLTLSKGGDA